SPSDSDHRTDTHLSRRRKRRIGKKHRSAFHEVAHRVAIARWTDGRRGWHSRRAARPGTSDVFASTGPGFRLSPSPERRPHRLAHSATRQRQLPGAGTSKSRADPNRHASLRPVEKSAGCKTKPGAHSAD